MSQDMSILAEIDNYESMFFDRSWHGIGEIELTINRHKRYTDTLLKNNIILVGVHLDKVFIIKHREIQLDEDGKITENWLIRGYSLKSIVSQRITIPPVDNAYDIINANAETVMKHYINKNLVNPIDPKRKIPRLVIAPDLKRGLKVNYASRFKNVAEEMSILSIYSGLGWLIYLDLDNKQWVFDVNQGHDLTVNQSVLPPVIFSPEFDSLKSLQYIQSELNYKNIAYIGGQGEGLERRVVEIGEYDGMNRHEIFVDARDISERGENDEPIPAEVVIQQLAERGSQELSELDQEEYLEGEILTKSPFKYEKDYNLGDLVTLQTRDWGVTLDSRLTIIKEIYEVDGFHIEATFGNSRPTLIQKIKQELRQISVEVRK